jgi:hypothetical protein
MSKRSRLSRDQKRKRKLAERERRRLPNPKTGDEGLLTAMEEIVTDFATQVGCEAPRFVERIPQAHCEVADCHANVIKQVHFHGGGAVWGWHFTLNTADPDHCCVDAGFHAVWEAPNGDLIDITPQSERVMAGWEAGVFTPLPFFCEDKRYFKECKVEDLGNGLLHFQTVQEVFPDHEACRLMLPIEECLPIR